MLMTRAGSPGPAARSRSGRQARVRWKTPFTFKASTLSHAASGYSASGAPQLAPALLTRTWSAVSRRARASARPRAPASVEQSAGSETHVPCRDSSAATWSHTSALREEMYTFAPASTKPRAIMSPMPREPPVTRATLPSMEKRFDIGGTMPRRRAEGKGRSPGEALPEVQEALRAFMARQWEAWLDTKLPALRFEMARGR